MTLSSRRLRHFVSVTSGSTLSGWTRLCQVTKDPPCPRHIFCPLYISALDQLGFSHRDSAGSTASSCPWLRADGRELTALRPSASTRKWHTPLLLVFHWPKQITWLWLSLAGWCCSILLGRVQQRLWISGQGLTATFVSTQEAAKSLEDKDCLKYLCAFSISILPGMNSMFICISGNTSKWMDEWVDEDWMNSEVT